MGTRIGAIAGGATGAVAGLAGSAKCWTKGITDKHWTALFDMFFWTALILGIGALLGSQNNGASMGLRLGQFGVIAFIFNIGVVTVHAYPGMFALRNSTVPDDIHVKEGE